MLQSRVLPPIVRSPPLRFPTPVATFFNVPRRYVKSNMQVGDVPPESPMDHADPPLSLRKSSRIHGYRSTPTSSPVDRTKQEDVPLSALTSPRSTRKRLASLVEVVEEARSMVDDSPTDNKTPTSATSNGSSDCTGHVCLCQPEPKIPRPRNAFILYRQHHQQTIIAHNTGLNNPEISKIIGEQWKAESEDQKKIWQDLAQEEKVRHQEQYPDYRYQPRRSGKPVSSPLNPLGQHTTVDKYRCSRCGGRSIKTPTSPFLDSLGTPTLPPPNLSEGLTPTARYLPVMSNPSMESPARCRGHGPLSLSNIQVSAAMRGDAGMYSLSPLKPNKQRRFDYGPPPSSNGRRSDGPYYPQYARRDSLPPIQVRYSPPNSATMQPPGTPRDGRRGSIVEIGPSPQDTSPRSVEGVLGAFPYPNKIKLLGRITPPYKEPSTTNPASQSRGAIIAVEGDDLRAIREIAEWLNKYLVNQKEYTPRIAEPPLDPKDENKDVTFEDYLDLIKEWHGRSRDMIKYITTSTASSLSSQDSISSDKDSDKDVSNNKASTPPPASPVLAAMSRPVIILPTFQFHASVAYASRIPIQDAYSATDHWQWMATLWRGTVGPDLTIYVKSYDAKEGQTGSKPDMDDVARCLTVSKEKEGKFAEADLRRVGFEVSEWIQGIGSGKGV